MSILCGVLEYAPVLLVLQKLGPGLKVLIVLYHTGNV